MNDLSVEKWGFELAFDEEYMSANHLDYFKAVLEQWKEDISKENELAVMHLQQETSPIADANDRATQEENFSLTLKARDRERKLINKINAALERINNKDFGFCELCDSHIGLGRLKARPTAELCIDCKEIEEKKEKKGFAVNRY